MSFFTLLFNIFLTSLHVTSLSRQKKVVEFWVEFSSLYSFQHSQILLSQTILQWSEHMITRVSKIRAVEEEWLFSVFH